MRPPAPNGPRERTVRLTGNGVIGLMRRHHVTIRQLSERFNITQRRVREVRAKGVEGFVAEDWIRMITGEWPGGGTGSDGY